MGQNFQELPVPANGAGNIPDVSKINDLIGFVNLVPFNLVRNGNFEFFSLGASVAPDFWTLTGAGAAVAKEASIVKLDSFSVKVTYGAAAAVLSQQAASFSFYKGKEVKIWCYIYSSAANVARITIDDGVGQASSDFHPGDGTWRFFSAKKVISNAATKLELQLSVEGAGSAYFDVAVMVDFDSVTGFLPNLADAALAASVAVARNGSIAARPASPAVGEFYLATDTGLHILFCYTGDFTDGKDGWVTIGGGG